MACAYPDRRAPLLGRLRRMRRTRLMAAVLLALLLRALIPLGFMPAADGTLSLMICPAGLAPGLLPEGKGKAMPDGGMMSGHQRPGQGAMDDSHCIFCTGFSAAPPAQLPATLFLVLAIAAAFAVTMAAPAAVRLVHLPQARAPPAPV